jgi:DNA-binding NtrC family response regulator
MKTPRMKTMKTTTKKPTAEKLSEAEAQALAEQLRTWRGNLPQVEAAKLLGMSARTLEGVEAGRGFRYPTMLKIAMESRKAAR